MGLLDQTHDCVANPPAGQDKAYSFPVPLPVLLPVPLPLCSCASRTEPECWCHVKQTIRPTTNTDRQRGVPSAHKLMGANYMQSPCIPAGVCLSGQGSASGAEHGSVAMVACQLFSILSYTASAIARSFHPSLPPSAFHPSLMHAHTPK